MVESYLSSFSSRDVDLISGHVDAEFVNRHHSQLGGASTGIDEYRKRLPGFLAMFDGLAYEIESLVADGDTVMAAYRMTATHDGHAIDIHGVMAIEVVNGLIASRTDYWDSLTFLTQTGQA